MASSVMTSTLEKYLIESAKKNQIHYSVTSLTDLMCLGGRCRPTKYLVVYTAQGLRGSVKVRAAHSRVNV